jgi:hypothetical protein
MFQLSPYDYRELIGTDVSIIRFSDLSKSHQMALILNQAVDSINWDKVSLETVTSDLGYSPDGVVQELEALLPQFVFHYGREYFVVANIPVKRLTDTAFRVITEKDWFTPKNYSNWEDYHDSFLKMNRVPNHGDDARWPVLLTAEESVIRDGWKRLHSYVRDGHTHIPVIYF